jgi:hypothetical protein
MRRTIARGWTALHLPCLLNFDYRENHMRRLAISSAASAVLYLFNQPAQAQYAPVDPVQMGQTATSTMANKLSGDIATGNSRSNSVSTRCLADSGPGPERRAMEDEYRRRLAAEGTANADAWRAEHGRRYRAALVAAGKCK